MYGSHAVVGIYYIFIFNIYNSKIAICIVVETIQDIKATELFNGSFVQKTLFSPSAHPYRYFLNFLHLIFI